MTGRELIAALRPMEQHAKAILRFGEIAQEAIKLEAGLALAGARLQETQAILTSAQAEVDRLTHVRQGLEAELTASRIAAEQKITAHLAARMDEAESQAARAEAVTQGWVGKAKQAEAEYAHRVARLKADETALAAHVDALRELAQRMAKAAEAVPR